MPTLPDLKNSQQDFEDFNYCLKLLGGKELTKADVDQRTKYLKGLDKKQEQAYYRLFHLWDLYDGDYDQINAAVDAETKGKKPAEKAAPKKVDIADLLLDHLEEQDAKK